MYFFLFHLIFYSPNIQSSILNGDCTNLKWNSVFTVHWNVHSTVYSIEFPLSWMFDVQYNVVSFLSSESHSNVRWEKMRGWDADLNEIFSIIICIRFFTLRNTNSFSQTFYSKRMMRWMWWCTCIRIWRSFGSLDSSSE